MLKAYWKDRLEMTDVELERLINSIHKIRYRIEGQY